MALIGLISDVHASAQPVAEAMAIFEREGVDRILCAGDIAGYMDQLDETIDLLIDNNCLTVMGNHDLQHLDKNPDDSRAVTFLSALPAIFEETIAGKRLYMVHAKPPDGHPNSHIHGGIKLLDKTGSIIPERLAYWSHTLQDFDADVLIIGHTHQVFVEDIGGTLVINPGSTAFNHSCAILRLPEMTVELFSLSGKDIAETWNWGEHVIYGHD